MTTEEIALHEAGHAAMAIFLGIPVLRVALDERGGYVRYEPHSHTPIGAVRRMMVILGGLIESARDGTDIPDWPIDPYAGREGEYYDREMLKTLSDRLRFTDSEWRRILVTALTISDDRFYRALVTCASGLLDFTPTIDRELLDRAVTIAEKKGT